jgi:hypothetical protein
MDECTGKDEIVEAFQAREIPEYLLSTHEKAALMKVAAHWFHCWITNS